MVNNEVISMALRLHHAMAKEMNMRPTNTSPADLSPQADVLAIHVMGALTRAQTQGRGITLDDLVNELGVRKTDLRRVVSTLHAQGFVDALRMRPTMLGFALGTAAGGDLLALRSVHTVTTRALDVAA